MKHLGIALLSSLALLACTEEQPASAPGVEVMETAEAPPLDFDGRMLKISQDYFALRPETATYYGVPDDLAGRAISSRLSNYSPVGEIERRDGLKAILDELASIDKSALTENQKVSLELVETEALGAYTPSTIADYGFVLGDYGVWFNPYVVSHLTGPQVEIPAILEDKMAVRTRVDAMAYLTRLNNYALVLDDAVRKMEFDNELGVLPPDFSIDRTIENLTESIRVPAAENSLVTSFSQKLNDAGLERADEFVAQAIDLVDEQVYPATRRMIEALAAVRPMASHEAGIGRLPNGAALYRAMITQMTDTTLSPEEIHAIGLVEVERIHGEMDVLLQSHWFNRRDRGVANEFAPTGSAIHLSEHGRRQGRTGRRPESRPGTGQCPVAGVVRQTAAAGSRDPGGAAAT